MHKQVSYIAADGTVFSTAEGCEGYERHLKFMNELTSYLQRFLPECTDEELQLMEKLWVAIYNYPNEFESVLLSAKPKRKRGRPRKTRACDASRLPSSNKKSLHSVDSDENSNIASTAEGASPRRVPVIKKKNKGAWRQ